MSIYALNQWVVWRHELQPGKIKPVKIPVNPHNLKNASSTNPATWSDFSTAVNVLTVNPSLAGIGFILTPNDPYFLIDLDGCRDSVTGIFTPDAMSICSQFPGAAWEYSQSGEGVHIIGQCDGASLAAHRNKWDGWCEFYTANRFIAFSPSGGGILAGNPDVDWTDTLRRVVPMRPVGPDGAMLDDDAIGSGPRADWCGPSDDEELIRRFLASDGGPAAKLGAAPRPADLWNADSHVLGAFYPCERGERLFDASSADQALMNQLAYWTGCDRERMIRLFSQSAFGQRDKWKNRAYYRNHTTHSSVRTTRKVYQGNRMDRKLADQKIGDAFSENEHRKIPVITLEDANRDFVFIMTGNTGYVGHRTTREVHALGLMKTLFQGSTTTVETVDQRNGEVKLKQRAVIDVWLTTKQFYENTVAWNPNAGGSCESAEDAKPAFNLWRGLIEPTGGERMLGDAALRAEWLKAWERHLAFLVPVEAERIHFERWLAHIVQRPGELPQTGWIFITEKTGVGRNWLASVLVRVIRGYVASNMLLDDVLTGSFNGRMSQKLLGIVDEAKAGMEGPGRWILKEKSKTLINPETRLINIKGGMQYVELNCMRWLIFSNNWDAIALDPNDRRYNVVANPTDKPGPEYYEWLYDHLHRSEFIAAVWAHLKTLDISAFRPGLDAGMNDAKRRLLESVSSDLEAGIDAFKAIWPGRVAFARHLREFLAETNQNGKPVAEMTLQRVAMTRGIKFQKGRCQERNAKYEKIIIIDPTISLDKIENIALRDNFISEILKSEANYKFGTGAGGAGT